MDDPKRLDPEEALDCYLSEARDGASDHWLAEQADVSVRQVRLWKQKRGLAPATKPSNRDPSALRGLLAEYDPLKHQAADSVLWETPRFVLRDPLDYTQFARACFHLGLAGFTSVQTARAVGVRVDDVERALGIWRRHLSNNGEQCACCDTLIDPRFGPFCSKACHDAAR